MQELIMTSQFNPMENVPDEKFHSAAFCVFSNNFLTEIAALLAVQTKHGTVFSNNIAPLWAFIPCALSNAIRSWSQYTSPLKYVLFPTQTVFKSTKIIPVMIRGKFLQGMKYSLKQYVESLLRITIGVASFYVASPRVQTKITVLNSSA
jgi:adenosine 3'-phospho 5'-phosphosulfate transporter B2